MYASEPNLVSSSVVYLGIGLLNGRPIGHPLIIPSINSGVLCSSICCAESEFVQLVTVRMGSNLFNN